VLPEQVLEPELALVLEQVLLRLLVQMQQPRQRQEERSTS
jgi:hypothetical protein